MDESESARPNAYEASTEEAVASAPPGVVEKVVHSRMGVLILCFGVLGFFGVPLIWVSRGFSRRQKVVWSVVVILYTLVLIAITAASVWFAWRQWQEILN